MQDHAHAEEAFGARLPQREVFIRGCECQKPMHHHCNRLVLERQESGAENAFAATQGGDDPVLGAEAPDSEGELRTIVRDCDIGVCVTDEVCDPVHLRVHLIAVEAVHSAVELRHQRVEAGPRERVERVAMPCHDLAREKCQVLAPPRSVKIQGRDIPAIRTRLPNPSKGDHPAVARDREASAYRVGARRCVKRAHVGSGCEQEV